MDRWKIPDLKHPRDEVFEDWTKRGLGRVIFEEDGYGTHIHFSISDAGVAYGLALERKVARQTFSERLRRNGIPLFNALAAFVAAVAAIVAAYFSYLALPGK